MTSLVPAPGVCTRIQLLAASWSCQKKRTCTRPSLSGSALSVTVAGSGKAMGARSEEHTSELQSRPHLVCRLLLEKKKKKKPTITTAFHTINNIQHCFKPARHTHQ